jgi:hypothetical protein
MRSLLLPSLAAGLLFFLPVGARAQDETKAIIDKAIKAHGGAEKLTKERAAQTKSKGTLSVAGMDLPFTEETFVHSGRLKSVLQLEAGGQTFNVITVFNGEKAWVKDPTGNTMELDGKLLEETKEAVYLVRLARFVFLKDKAVELAPLGEVKVNGKPAVGVKVSSKGHRDVNLFFDKESGLLAKIERQALDQMTGNDVTEERIITEYQEVDGVKVPKKALVNRDSKKFVDVEILEVKSLDKFDDSEFAKP